MACPERHVRVASWARRACPERHVRVVRCTWMACPERHVRVASWARRACPERHVRVVRCAWMACPERHVRVASCARRVGVGPALRVTDRTVPSQKPGCRGLAGGLGRVKRERRRPSQRLASPERDLFEAGPPAGHPATPGYAGVKPAPCRPVRRRPSTHITCRPVRRRPSTRISTPARATSQAVKDPRIKPDQTSSESASAARSMMNV